MTSMSSKKILNLSQHSFTDTSDQNVKKGRRFSNINTQAVIYCNEHLQQLFTGLYLDDNLHNVGTYRWLSDCNSHKYEGKLFLNNLHGYGKLIYPDDALYEGLFYFNKKFGPGVITYNNQTQDVGLWNGNYLIRLSNKFSISDYYKEYIPKLSGLIPSKLFILQFKKLIPISEKYKDYAKDMLIKLGAPDTVLANKNKLYSKLVRNPNSVFINGEKLYKNFFTYEDELYTTIDVVDHFDEYDNPVVIKLEVCNLVAWNNEEINTVILKHAFLNRHYERLLSFNIKDVLCTNKRGNFLPPGPIETKSQELLLASRSTDSRLIRRIITENDIYPDVADCRGNNTITYATLANQNKNIKVLAEFGANLNSFNDDCITPLMFAILQYIAIKYDITSTLWEPAFIYAKTENDLPPCNQQWPMPSTTSLNENSCETSQKSFDQLSSTSKSSSSTLNLDKSLNEVSMSKDLERRESLVSLLKDYIFPLDCVRTKRVPAIRKTIDLNMKIRKSEEALETNATYQQFKIDEAKKITQTIETLLLCGANPNIGEVPFCPIITCIFTRSKHLIKMLISFNASINAKTCEHLGRLGPLHVIGSLNPCLQQLQMAFIFLENGAYVDDLANKIHWLEEQSILLADKPPQDQLEKTPLHLICMRYDFNDDPNNYLTKLALIFIQYGANLNLKYLGHTPLTLAMMRGNTALMENLLETGLIDPNESLGYNMGVPLTMCILNRYNKIMSIYMVKDIYSILMRFYANPFKDVPNFNGNAIEFYYNEQNMLHPSKRQSFSKPNSGSLLLNFARIILLKYIESKIIQTLYHYKIICNFDSTLYHNIVKFLNFTRTLDILQILIDYDVIVVNDLNLQKLLYLVDKREFNDIYFIKSDEIYKKFQFNNYMPELDPDDSKYKVCFECFRKTNKLLMLCPKCEMVYFCSAACNEKNLKDPYSNHPCKGNFYESEKMFALSNRKRSTKTEHLLNKNIKLKKLLSFANMDIEDFGKLGPKEKRSSIIKIKKKQDKHEKQKLDEINKLVDKKTSASESDIKEKKSPEQEKSKTKATDEKKKYKDEKLKKSLSKSIEEKPKIKASKDNELKSEKSTSKDIDKKLKKSFDGNEDVEKMSEENIQEETLRKAETDKINSMKKLETQLLKSSMLEAEYDDEPITIAKSIPPKIKEKGRKKIVKKKESLLTRSVTFSKQEALFKKGDKTGKPEKSSKRSLSKHSTGTDIDEDSSSKASSKKRKGGKASTTTSTDFGENMYNKVNLNLKKKVLKAASSVKQGLSIFIGSKKPVIDLEKRNMYLKLRAQMLEKDRQLNARKNVTVQSQFVSERHRMDKNCTERMLQLARTKIPNLPKDYGELDVKFWQLFSPYCIFQNGQLYYNFNEENGDVYYKVTYSSV